jgi:hypothetical protein
MELIQTSEQRATAKRCYQNKRLRPLSYRFIDISTAAVAPELCMRVNVQAEAKGMSSAK